MVDSETGENLVAIPESMNLHASLPTQSVIESLRLEKIEPTHSVQTTGSIKFEISSNENELIDPYNTYVFTKFKIVGADGADMIFAPPDAHGVAVPDVDTTVLPINGLGSSIFKSIEVKLNNEVIASCDNLYAFKADLENRLMTSTITKNNSLTLSGFDQEIKAFETINHNNIPWATAFNSIDVANAATNNAFARRWFYTNSSKSFTCVSRIYSEIFDQSKPLPPNSTLSVSFDRNEDKFCLLTKRGVAFQLKLEECYLIASIPKINDKFIKEVEYETYKGAPYKFPLRRVDMQYFTRGPGAADFSINKLIKGDVLPRRIFFGFLSWESYSGAYSHDPFNYQDMGVSTVILRIDGQITPLPTINCNFLNNSYPLALYGLLRATSSFLGDAEIGINTHNYHRNM